MTKIPLLTLKHYYKPQTHSLFMVGRRGEEAGFLDRLGIFPIRDEKYRSTVDRPYNKRCQYKHNQSHVLYMKVMNQLVRRAAHVSVRWRVLEGVSIFRHIFQHIWGRVLCCATGRCSVRYRRLASQSRRSSSPSPETGVESGLSSSSPELGAVDSDLVTLKISLLGDCQIGKSSFVIKYAGNEPETSILQMEGLNLTDKTLSIQDARISFSIWDVGGDKSSLDHVPIACKDSVAILFMFDLTSRCTLNSVIDWYKRARKWNQTAIPIIIGTKFDDFVKLPPNLQWTIITQARAYAKAMKATLFFSSSTHNINVNKIFKFIMAKLFNLPWTVQRNLTVGEPIIDF